MNILNDVKARTGLDKSFGAFDDELLLIINSLWSYLDQIGVSMLSRNPVKKTSEWSEYIPSNRLGMIPELVAINVRMRFDPPSSSSVLESLRNTAKELEWRVYLSWQN